MSLPLNRVILGDCSEVMRGGPDNSIDCVVTDPPYGLNSMGKSWDKALPPKHSASVMKEGVPIVE
jgi:DNA modification methylase